MKKVTTEAWVVEYDYGKGYWGPVSIHLYKKDAISHKKLICNGETKRYLIKKWISSDMVNACLV